VQGIFSNAGVNRFTPVTQEALREEKEKMDRTLNTMI